MPVRLVSAREVHDDGWITHMIVYSSPLRYTQVMHSVNEERRLIFWVIFTPATISFPIDESWGNVREIQSRGMETGRPGMETKSHGMETGRPASSVNEVLTFLGYGLVLCIALLLIWFDRLI